MSQNKSPSKPALCVAIHDVAPATWPECLRLLRALRAVADIPVTWLVIPHYHGSRARSPACENMLTTLLADGHEVALHGYTHQDCGAAPLSWRERFLRSVYSQGEGEFAAIEQGEAARRIELGLAWLRQREWPVSGFVAPAWLLGAAAWTALQEYGFSYTTTWQRFYRLPRERGVFAPALVYSARNRSGRALSPLLAAALARSLRRAPLVRLALHPRDAYYPALIRHTQQLLERLLAQRAAMTKAAFARAYQ